jgi:hypothetical protein
LSDDHDRVFYLALRTPVSNGFNWSLWVGAPASTTAGFATPTAPAFIAFKMGGRRAD